MFSDEQTLLEGPQDLSTTDGVISMDTIEKNPDQGKDSVY